MSKKIKSKCWNCRERPVISEEHIFCKKCDKIKVKETTQTLVIYDKV